MVARGKPLLGAALLVGAYQALALLALLATGPAEVTLIWPATGVIYAAMLYLGMRWWLLPVICVLLMHALLAPVPLAFLPWSVASNLFGSLAGVWFVRRVAPTALGRFDVSAGAALLAGGAILSVVSALFGTLGMWLSGQSPASELFTDAMRWTMGDLFGIVAVTPAALVAMHTRGSGIAEAGVGYASRAELRTWAAVTLSILLGTALLGGTRQNYALAMVGLPLAAMVWCAVRLPARITAFANAALALLMATAANLGFAGFPPPTSPLDAATLAAFLCVIAAIPMTLSMGMHQSRQASARLLRRASTDPLTGALNRSAFERQVRQALQGPDTGPMALAYIDLDRFRLVNDALTHAVGDELICAVAGVLGDSLARLGGDEFAVLMRNADAGAALLRARALCEAVAGYRFQAGEHVAAPTISIGLVPFGSGEGEFGTLLALADTACFAAKELGGNRLLALRMPFLAIGAVLPWLLVRIAARAQDDEAAAWKTGLLALLLPLSGTLGLMALPAFIMMRQSAKG